LTQAVPVTVHKTHKSLFCLIVLSILIDNKTDLFVFVYYVYCVTVVSGGSRRNPWPSRPRPAASLGA